MAYPDPPQSLPLAEPPFDPDLFTPNTTPFVSVKRHPDGTFLAIDATGLRWVFDPQISKWWRPEGWEPPRPGEPSDLAASL
jgi:hypothetical protein